MLPRPRDPGQLDEAALELALGREPAYLGLVASRGRAASVCGIRLGLWALLPALGRAIRRLFARLFGRRPR